MDKKKACFKTQTVKIKNEEDLKKLREITTPNILSSKKKKEKNHGYIPGVGDDGDTIGLVIEDKKLDLMFIS